jgi:hypothetical protein
MLQYILLSAIFGGGGGVIMVVSLMLTFSLDKNPGVSLGAQPKDYRPLSRVLYKKDII